MFMRAPARYIAAATVLIISTSSARPVPGDTRVPSRIVAATVYTDRAMVTREAKAEIAPGLRHVTLGGLPPLLQDQSVRVAASGSAQAKIVEVKVDQVFLDTISAARIAPLLQSRKNLNADIRVLNDRLAVIAHQRDFLNKITIASQESIARELRTQKPTADDWGKLLGFFDAEYTKLDGESRQIDEKRGALQQKLEAVEKELGAAGGSPEKKEKTITVAFDVMKGGSVVLEASYLISQAGWSPSYDIRVSSADTIVELTYSALVRQNTGEDWKDVRMTLSTSQPALGGAPPELQPWYVGASDRAQGSVEGSVRDAGSGDPLVGVTIQAMGTPSGTVTDANGYYRIGNVPSGWQVLRISDVGYQTVNLRVNVRPYASARADVSLNEASVTVGAVEITANEPAAKKSESVLRAGRADIQTAPPAPVSYQTAEVKESLTSASFPVAGENTVPADNADHKVTVMVAPLAGSFSHSTVPKLQPDAFFKAALTNSTDFPILPGPTSVYVDNGFVSTSKLAAVMPGEKFDAFLGADNGVHIERKLVNKVTEVSGLFSKTRKTRYEILITAQNRKKIAERLSIRENVPVSQDERVKVEITAPRPEEAAPDAGGIITWQIRLAPGEKREIKVQYSIEAPADLSVGGLE